jgi:NAD(P)-dependent dehydrogenase (short-subunit alcohol dehydrogenase family)
MGLTEALALELAEDGILVNAIAPGPILAPETTTDEELKAVESATPLGKWGGESEIATAVLFLLESGFVTGETIRVDGGRHIK